MSYKLWFQTYLRHPLQLGALFPSGSALSSLMVRHIKPEGIGHVLELGPGTGSFTNALVRIGIPEERLVLIEQSQEFAAFLSHTFPRATVICGNADEAGHILKPTGIGKFDEVVSGIPLKAMGKELRKSVCHQAFSLLNPGGSLVQVSYFPRCSIPRDSIRDHSGKTIFCGVTVRNFPPAFVWRVQTPG